MATQIITLDESKQYNVAHLLNANEMKLVAFLPMPSKIAEVVASKLINYYIIVGTDLYEFDMNTVLYTRIENIYTGIIFESFKS